MNDAGGRGTAMFELEDYHRAFEELAQDMEEMAGAGFRTRLFQGFGEILIEGEPCRSPAWKDPAGRVFPTARAAVEGLPLPPFSERRYSGGVCRVHESEADTVAFIWTHAPGRRFLEPPTPAYQAWLTASRYAKDLGLDPEPVCARVREAMARRAVDSVLAEVIGETAPPVLLGPACRDLLTEEEAIGYLRLDTIQVKYPAETLRRYRREGHLRGTQVGKRVFYLRTELDALLRKLTEINPR